MDYKEYSIVDIKSLTEQNGIDMYRQDIYKSIKDNL